ncbi:SURF1 family protein [Hyphobacterium sp.]|uniref:SURF1 family protein n=1 Tax=Hyphobacterium sp. TaxID=2004662 RepID=UPI003BADA388
MPILTLVLLPALALLIWLGSWQFGRMGEKAEALAAWERRTSGPAIELDAALCEVRASFFDRDVLLPLPSGDNRLRFQGRSAAGEPGWRLMGAVPVPACFDADGAFALVQTGFETARGERFELFGPVTISRLPEAGAFTPSNLPPSDEFYRFEAEELADALNVASVTSAFWLVAASDGLPPHLASVPPSQHLGYALTWWGLALALLGVFAVMHVQAGRLGFTRR